MKVETTKAVEFVPRSITITFEKQEELDLFGSVFNSANICAVLDKNGFGNAHSAIRNRIEVIGGNITKYTINFKGI